MGGVPRQTKQSTVVGKMVGGHPATVSPWVMEPLSLWYRWHRLLRERSDLTMAPPTCKWIWKNRQGREEA
jgi:hypothetical protein